MKSKRIREAFNKILKESKPLGSRDINPFTGQVTTTSKGTQHINPKTGGVYLKTKENPPLTKKQLSRNKDLERRDQDPYRGTDG